VARSARLDPLAAVAVVALATVLVWLSRSPEDERRGTIVAAHTRGLQFLAATQREDGGFPTYHWYATRPAKLEPVNAVFTASQILYSLAPRDEDSARRRIQERAVAYLLSEEEPPGVWHYYGRAGAHLLSPDVDDTALAWAALARHGRRVSPAALAQLRASRNERGLLNTWIGDPATWIGVDSRDVDMVVNLNGLLLFALAGERLDEVCRQVVTHTTSGAFLRGSVYYPSPLAFTYALTRAYADGGAACLTDAVATARQTALGSQQPDGGWGDDFQTALGVLTLLHTGARGEAVERGVEAIVARQSADGGWALAPAYRAAVLPVSYGSRSLTTALCLEALSKHLGRWR
jgi:hypothetical protein